MRKTKIVVTIGPSTSEVEMLEQLLRAGANIFRLNFSHSDLAEHERRLQNIRAAVSATGLAAEVIQDLSGPKIRIGSFKSSPVALREGDIFTLTTDDCVGDETRVSVNYPLLPREILPGAFVYIDDGTKKLQVTEIKGNDVVCKVLIGGEIGNQKGLNLPGSNLSVKSLTEKDRADLEFGIKHAVDFVALSFVRAASDILELRKILNERWANGQGNKVANGIAQSEGNVGTGRPGPEIALPLRPSERSGSNFPISTSKIKIIAKIETPQAMENIDAIIAAADWLMVARGDLAIETPFEKVPIEQKIITEKCNAAGKPTIVATQMMESMVESVVPTRAEVSDVANAVLDGAEAVMLSEETAMGKHPVEVVVDMAKIIEETERDAGMVRNEIGS